MHYEIIWPERRIVDESVIRDWYEDAVANQEVDLTDLTHPDDQARELSQAGLITLGRGR